MPTQSEPGEGGDSVFYVVLIIIAAVLFAALMYVRGRRRAA
jgi:hypothetical protein